MSVTRKLSGLTIAAAAAGLFAAGIAAPTPASADVAKYQCMGVNACKGQSACKTASSSCKGQNACKGQGWIATDTQGECLVQGGKVAS